LRSLHQAGDAAQQRGLAGAVMAQDADRLATTKTQVDAAQHFPAAISGRELSHFKDGFSRSLPRFVLTHGIRSSGYRPLPARPPERAGESRRVALAMIGLLPRFSR
jgi:hypothetical protein